MNKKLLIYRFAFIDLIAAVVVWILFMIFRRVVNDGVLFQHVTVFVPNFNYYTNLALFPLLCFFINYLSGYYVNPIKESRFVDFLTTFFSSALISIIIFFTLLLDDLVVSYEHYYYSLLVLFLLLFIVTYSVRLVQTSFINRNIKKRKWTINTLIVGTGENALKLQNEMENALHFNTVVGFIKTDSLVQKVATDMVLGNMFDIGKVIENKQIKEVLIALDNANEKRIFEIINKLFQYDVEIQFTPGLYEILTGKVRFQRHGMQPLVSITQLSMSDWELCVKRAFDISASFLSLVLLSPILLYFSILIKLDSRGSVFYKQSRVGLHGKEFSMLKFRTMYVDSEKGVPKLSSPDDERITKIGRVLRKYRLDEIPQFVNVIKGEMSIVGPRPERKYYIEQIIKEAPYYCLIYRLQPGLTSWGPIKIGYSDTIEKMIERLNYDIVYLENMNLMTDLKIIIYTLEILFKGKGV